jgi:DNA repair exonuclease SbcCD ATPase subunit
MLVFFLPQKDLLGFLRKRDHKQEQTRQLQEAKVDINKAADPVKLAIKQLGEPEFSDELAKLEQGPKDAKPEEIKRQAIRKLGDLSDKIKKMQGNMKLESINKMQQMFKQLKGSPDVFSQKLRLALARGNFSEASNLLSQAQKQLAEGKLNEQQRKALSEQLQNLARELRKLAQKNEELEKELEKLGLDKKLAELDMNQLRRSLQKQGLSVEKIDELLQKASAIQSASSRCQGLGSAMAGCGAGAGGLSGDELANVIEQLDELEAIKQQLMLTEASLAEIERAIAGLGEGMCQGIGGQGPFMEGISDKFGSGTGGPGMGYGPRSMDETGETSTKKTRLKNKPGQGPVIASWYFKDIQVTGEAEREFSEVLQAGRDRAAEAISDNQIPRKYEDAIKKYFSQLDHTGGK